MLILIHGSDSLARQSHLQAILQDKNTAVEAVTASDAMTVLSKPSEPVLFGSVPVLLVTTIPAELTWGMLEPWLTASQTLVISVDKLDGRQKLSKELLGHKQIQRYDAAPPTGPNRLNWVREYLERGGVSATPQLMAKIVDVLDPPPSPASFGSTSEFNTEQARHELDKLIAYAGPAGVITADAITELLSATDTTIAFDISTAVAERNRTKALAALEQYMNAQSGDITAACIQLSALLAEQFRNLLVVRDFVDRGVPDTAIAQTTGFKTGRIFILKKSAVKFTTTELQSLVQKLQNLDQEIKTGGMPPHVVLDLIIAALVP